MSSSASIAAHSAGASANTAPPGCRPNSDAPPQRRRAPRGRGAVKDSWLHLRWMGTTVLISAHILGELEAMCTHALILGQGSLVGMEDLTAPAERAVVVAFAGGETETFTVADEEAQVELVRSLVAEGRPVVAVAEGIPGPGEGFLAPTRGDSTH